MGEYLDSFLSRVLIHYVNAIILYVNANILVVDMNSAFLFIS